MRLSKEQQLQDILNRAVDGRKVFGASFCIRYGHLSWCGSSGNMETGQQYFIASTTKLFVTAVVLHYRCIGLLSLDDKIERYLSSDILKGLHVLKGQDYSSQITVRNLLSHTSGIPDYFQGKDESGDCLETTLVKAVDKEWDFDQAIERSKSLKALFVPGTKGKAHYSDTNFQLLGRIIEIISKKPISEVFKELIFNTLGLEKTYLYKDIKDQRPKAFYYKRSELYIPKAMASFGPDGGIVSTSHEMMLFLEAFFNGAFFPVEYIAELRKWNRIFFPMQSGVGIHRFKMLRVFDPFGTIPELIGHSGLSGALAFCSPEKGFYVTGTINQVAHPDMSFRLMIKLIQKVFK